MKAMLLAHTEEWGAMTTAKAGRVKGHGLEFSLGHQGAHPHPYKGPTMGPGGDSGSPGHIWQEGKELLSTQEEDTGMWPMHQAHSSMKPL
jgi:hypothetical protein